MSQNGESAVEAAEKKPLQFVQRLGQFCESKLVRAIEKD
jgi:hypothetical protein